MSFRLRLLTAFVTVVVLALATAGYTIRWRVSDQIVTQYRERVAGAAAQVRRDLDRRSGDLRARLRAVADGLDRDNQFRTAVLRGDAPGYVIDWAGPRMRQAGLDVLQVQGADGRIASSGHFRSEYDLLEPGLPRLIAAQAGGFGVMEARTAEETFLAVARADSVEIAGRTFYLVGGARIDAPSLQSVGTDPDLRVTLDLEPPGANDVGRPPELSPSGDSAARPVRVEEESGHLTHARPDDGDEVVSTVELPFIRSGIGVSGSIGVARIVVAQSLEPLREVQRTMDRWFLLALGAAALAALGIAGWLSTRISRPLAALADQTRDLELDRLDVAVASGRRDEVGELARAFGAMTARLKASLATLKEVERRAAIGDLARQVNHDVKNGLIPIRNVFRHLNEVAERAPADLGRVFAERRATVDSAVTYLEQLAARYAALYPTPERTMVDVNEVVEGTVRGRTPVRLDLRLAESLHRVRADEVALRRIVENLVVNAVDAAQLTNGSVSVTTESARAKNGDAMVRVTVADTGPGMTRDELDRAFGDFHTTKPGGTGLGLTIVRRLVQDLGGTLRVETEPGAGTRFAIELPADSGTS
jgi:signal transduction histidine kinase